MEHEERNEEDEKRRGRSSKTERERGTHSILYVNDARISLDELFNLSNLIIGLRIFKPVLTNSF